MIHLLTEREIDDKLLMLFNQDVELIGSYANKFAKTRNAVQQEYISDANTRCRLKLAMCLVMVSKNHDIDVNYDDNFLTIPDHKRIFYDKMSQCTNRFLNKELTYEEYINKCSKLQMMFVEWGEDDMVREEFGVVFAAASRDENSPYYGLHDLLEGAYLRIFSRE